MRPYTLEEKVWEYLLVKRESASVDLVIYFEKKKYTKQGVYRILRQFKKEGKVIRLQNYVALNLIWVQKEIERFGSLVAKPELFFETFEKTRTYSVNTLEELDLLYGQLFVTILSSHVKSLPHALFYDLHNYTYIHKVSTVDWYIDFLYKRAPKICLLVGSQSSLDSVLVKRMKHISVHQINKKWPCFISVLGEFIISNYVDKKVWQKIDTVFTGDDIAVAKEELLFLSRLKGGYRITVERNAKKAALLTKQFSRYFILPK